MQVSVRLNGAPATLEVAPGEMLHSALRAHGLGSVRETCAIGVCGACTVLLDGEAVTGCLTPAARAEGCEVTTVEGLPGDEPLLAAFVEHRAFQCGWCTPGFVLAARRLLQDNPAPSEEEIREGLAGNLCRCGSYLKIFDAVRACVAAPGEAA